MPSERTKSIGHRIKMLRMWRKIRQKELAKNLEMAQSRLSDLEAGKKPIPLETLLDIVEMLDVDLNYFDLRKAPAFPEMQEQLQ